MSRHLKFTKLDVFTSTPYVGNPLAIVHLTSTIQLSQAEKLLIARNSISPRRSSCMSPTRTRTPRPRCHSRGIPPSERGSSSSRVRLGRETVTLRAKAGDIPSYAGHQVASACKCRSTFRAHGAFPIPEVKDGQPRLADADYVNGLAGAEQVVSLVKGNTFVLIPVASTAALSRAQAYPKSLALPKTPLPR
ncbi:hypothetical protein C8F04DRAFT_1253498 [Mycena alexandri]|uniref:Uncharacterized protein n=1 Tax=Mycena alexandri TaxID=1745969 RepID=A0AAD6T7T2_9AGAR|nr:hypothetical protein C8F04DRAFT_1253498 [Mycena alexandri]